MISREKFKNKMEEARDLLGSTMKLSAFDAMYDRIKDNYIDKDFIQAIDAVVENGEKLIYPVLVKSLNTYKDRRMEAQRRDEKRQRSREMARLEGDRTKDLVTVKSIVDDLGKRLQFEGKFPDLPYVKLNSVLVCKDGSKENCFIDDKQPGFWDRVTVEHELFCGDISRRLNLNTDGLRVVRLTTRKDAE
jgi:hypothetical protein